MTQNLGLIFQDYTETKVYTKPSFKLFICDSSLKDKKLKKNIFTLLWKFKICLRH